MTKQNASLNMSNLIAAFAAKLGVMIGADRRVWDLRIEEADLWRAHAAKGAADPSYELINRQILAVLDRRAASILDAVASLSGADARIEEADRTLQARRNFLRIAREEMDEATERNRLDLDFDPKVLASGMERTKLETMIASSEGWEAELEPLVERKLAAFLADPVFWYLDGRKFGTEDYKARWPFAAMDARIANWAGYDKACAERTRILAYHGEYEANIRKARQALEANAARSHMIQLEIKSRLDDYRLDLADALNAEDRAANDHSAAILERSQTIGKLEAYIAGTDEEYVMVTDAIVALTARERAGAVKRSASGIEGTPTAAMVDDLLKRRIALIKGLEPLHVDAADLLREFVSRSGPPDIGSST